MGELLLVMHLEWQRNKQHRPVAFCSRRSLFITLLLKMHRTVYQARAVPQKQNAGKWSAGPLLLGNAWARAGPRKGARGGVNGRATRQCWAETPIYSSCMLLSLLFAYAATLQ